MQQPRAEQWIFHLDAPAQCTSFQQEKILFGGKGASLRQLVQQGIPTPFGFIMTTALCNAFYRNANTLPKGFDEALEKAIHALEVKMDACLGGADKNSSKAQSFPLLLSVRSGARASMPGMMDTILNLGLNDQTVDMLAACTEDKRFAFDSYRRFIQMYSNVVLGLGLQPFENILRQYRQVRGVEEDSFLHAADLQAITRHFLAHVQEVTGKPFPQDTRVQLTQAIKAVLHSWKNKRAVHYRQLYNIPETWGTAVTIQAMVFGNLGDNSATGVAFTRNPSTGENVFFGEYLLRAQGEDVVAGIRTPHRLLCKHGGDQALETVMPNVFQELCAVRSKLEKHFQDMQDIEFTVQQGKLWILQTRNGKRTGAAALRIATEMVEEGLLSVEEALTRVDPRSLDQLLHPQLDVQHNLKLLAQGLPASPGAGVGQLAFSSQACLELVEKGQPVILVRDETSPEDIEGMAASFGVITACGGMTSHAAVVARGMGKPCIVGMDALNLDSVQQTLSVKGVQLKAGDIVSMDGSTGEVFEGRAALIPPKLSATFTHFMAWVDQHRRMRVRANADTPQDVRKALSMGAEGVGLCRSEHMFFETKRILALRKMILAGSSENRLQAAKELFPLHKKDFTDILEVLDGKPLTVRLLDPPLHEFLPQADVEIDQLAQALGIRTAKVRARLLELKEANPMLGNRGCRLGLTMPEIYDMQVDALMAALHTVMQKQESVKLELMVPLISLAGEFRMMRGRIKARMQYNSERMNVTLPDIAIGAMIELPRAALKADKIARDADFLSFGTNDLTQTTFGFSRDDVASFLPTYRKQGLLEKDPFVSLDQSGVGELIRIAVQKARSVKPHIKLGVCGEQAADPESVDFFEELGLDYMSCSPYRVPVARLAVAQAFTKKES